MVDQVDHHTQLSQKVLAVTVCYGSIAALGLDVCITNWLEHYAPTYQFYGQGITDVKIHAFEDIVGEINDDIPRTISWVVAFHGCPHGFIHKGPLLWG